jgi:hypothetical protein
MLQPRDFKTQIEYDIYSNTKNWTISKWAEFRNKFYTNYYEQRDYANSLIYNKSEDKETKNHGHKLMENFKITKLNNIKKFNANFT